MKFLPYYYNNKKYFRHQCKRCFAVWLQDAQWVTGCPSCKKNYTIGIRHSKRKMINDIKMRKNHMDEVEPKPLLGKIWKFDYELLQNEEVKLE